MEQIQKYLILGLIGSFYFFLLGVTLLFGVKLTYRALNPKESFQFVKDPFHPERPQSRYPIVNRLNALFSGLLLLVLACVLIHLAYQMAVGT